MRIVRDLSTCPDACKGTVLALGNFDGVHIGHQAILKHAVDFARIEGKQAAAMTFEPHPREFFAPGHQPLRIYPLRRKIELLEEQGIDILFLMRFNKRFASIPAASFIEDVLHRQLQVSHVVTGYNFAFGKGRQGTTAMLTDEARKLGFGFTAIQPVGNESNTIISSSAIREALKAGDMMLASRMLGRSYEISGHVRHGARKAREMGFPTANLGLNKLFRPRFGVYSARVSFDRDLWHDAIANVGIKPTFSPTEPLLEVHFFGIDRMFYGERIHVRLLDFIRDEKRFPNVEALKTQIAEDCARAKTLLQGKTTS